jgi:hypothetical protein
MTVEQKESKIPSNIPFLFRYAEPLQGQPNQKLRYDEYRQIAQVFADGCWVDTPDARTELGRSTRTTKVRPETTDEQ